MKKPPPVQIEGQKTALLVIDVQTGLFQEGRPIYHADQLLDSITRLAERAQRAGVPVIYNQHSEPEGLLLGSSAWQLHPRLQPRPADRRVEKTRPNAFEDTPLGEILRQADAAHLVLCGLVTHGCVKATCRGALERGYQVTLVSDAHSNNSAQADQLIEKWNRQLNKLGAELKTAAEVTF